MTDHHDTSDELASAYLDGELSAEERGNQPVNETVRGRADYLATARDALQAMPAVVDPVQRDLALRAALAAFEDGPASSLAATEGEATASTVAAVAARHRVRRMARLGAIAAAVALVALSVPFLGHLDSGSDDVAGRTERADQSLRADAPASGAAPESMALAPSNDLEDLGSFGDVAALAGAVRTRMNDAAADAEHPPGAASVGGGSAKVSDDPCAAQRAEAAPVAFEAVAELDGRAVLVLVRAEEHGQTLLALDVDSCALVATQRL